MPASTSLSRSRISPRSIGLFFLFAGAIVLTLGTLFDGAVHAWLLENRVKALKNVAGWYSDIGDWPSMLTFSGVLFAIAWWFRRRQAARLILIMLLSALAAGLTADVVRVITGRARPNASVEPGWYGPHSGTNKLCSFPSAHTSFMAGFCVPLIIRGGRWRRRRQAVAVLAAAPLLLMAGARVYLSAHHVSDAATGIALGLVCGALISRWRARPTRLGKLTIPWIPPVATVRRTRKPVEAVTPVGVEASPA